MFGKIIKKQSVLKIITVMLIQAFLMGSFVYAQGLEVLNYNTCIGEDKLSPSINIESINFQNGYRDSISALLNISRQSTSPEALKSEEGNGEWISFVENLNIQTTFPLISFKSLNEGFEEIIETLQITRDFLTEFFSQSTPKQVEEIFSRLTGLDFKVSQLTGIIQVEYIAQGTHKMVFKVTFFTENSPLVLSLILKKGKEYDSISIAEITDLKWLNNIEKNAGQLVPKFGVQFDTSNGGMFLEEFIFGNTAEALKVQNKLSFELRKKIVSTFLVVGMLLGNSFCRDINYGNAIITPQEEAVVVDLGNKRLVLSTLLKNSDQVSSLVEFFMITSMYYNLKEGETIISDVFPQTMERVNSYLAKRHHQTLRQKLSARELEAQFKEAVDKTVVFLRSLTDSKKQEFIKQLDKRQRLNIFFQHEGKEFSPLERISYIEKHLEIILRDLSKISNQPRGPPQTAEIKLDLLRDSFSSVFLERSI